jgi:hypothetical protein
VDRGVIHDDRCAFWVALLRNRREGRGKSDGAAVRGKHHNSTLPARPRCCWLSARCARTQPIPPHHNLFQKPALLEEPILKLSSRPVPLRRVAAVAAAGGGRAGGGRAAEVVMAWMMHPQLSEARLLPLQRSGKDSIPL